MTDSESPPSGPATTGEPPAEGRLREALEQVKAALGDRLLGKGPLSKEYAHAVMRQIDDALSIPEKQPANITTSAELNRQDSGRPATATGEPAALEWREAEPHDCGGCCADFHCSVCGQPATESRPCSMGAAMHADCAERHRAAFAPGPRLSQAEAQALVNVMRLARAHVPDHTGFCLDLATLAPLLECAAREGNGGET